MFTKNRIVPVIRFILSLILVVAAMGLQSVSPVIASTLTVTNTNDSGAGSLRQAITDAVPGDTINFDAALSGRVITLSSTLVINKNLTIDGSALSTHVSISGNDEVRIFTIEPGVMVVLNGLIIRNGYSAGSYGGGIYNRGNLTVLNSTLLENTAAGYGLGGGIFSLSGTLIVENSLFIRNTATEGGGLNNNNGNTGSLSNVTFFENTASIGGGVNNHGVLNLSNVTISHNIGSGGVGGLYNAGTLNYKNSIIANSLGQDCYTDDFGTIGINTNNLVETPAASPNGCGAPSLTGNPQSGPLAYGGGLTRTMALLPGSSAIDAGDDTNCPATDQRGVTRPQGSHCDMGAYENEQAPAIFITDIPKYGWPLPDPYPNDANDDPMLGWVNNVIPPDAYKNYYVTCYIYVPDYPGITGESGWWVKPTYGLTKTSINPDGTWKCDVTTGGYDEYATKYRAYLFPATLANPPMLPPADCERPSCVEVLRDDISPPETTITTCPDAFTVLHDVSFEFHSSHTGNLLNCMLDGVENACTSPQSFNNLEVGEHTFSVYATDRVGNVDPSPASCTWEVYVPSMVSSITRIDPNPASAETVRFIVTFSETVTGVDLSDFALTTTGAVDAWIANVSGMGTAYTVTVKIKTGKGTLRLDVVDDDSIKNLDSNPLGGAGLGNGNFADGEMYFINRDPSLHSMILAPVSLRTQSGSVSGSLPTLSVLEQNGTEDNPAVYIAFQTPGTNYLGYLSYRLPGTVKLSTIASLNLQVNFKGPASSTQLWTWSVYDWTMRRWVKLGDTTGLSADVWQTLTFGIRNPGRVISVVGRELRIRLQSNNPAGDAKVDYMVVDLNYRSE